MGFSPQQVRRMSMWQFQAALEGYIKANNPPDNGLSAHEADELWDWLNDA